jgi:thiopeptide-type bacteriocin biosynthesis protein
LPELLTDLNEDIGCWFLRYRSPHQTDHLRLRVRVPDRARYEQYLAIVGQWAAWLRLDAVCSSLVFDSYQPETGRYGGDGATMAAAEDVFVADSRAVSAQLRHLAASAIDPTALAAASMVHLAIGLLGVETGVRWLADHAVTAGTSPDRTAAEQAQRLGIAVLDEVLPEWPIPVSEAWHARTAALGTYRSRLLDYSNIDYVIESLLHMHHNRALGIDPDSERAARRSARRAALAWQAHRGEPR